MWGTHPLIEQVLHAALAYLRTGWGTVELLHDRLKVPANSAQYVFKGNAADHCMHKMREIW